MQDTYSLHIEAEDEDGNTYSEWFTILVDDVNESPVANDDPSVSVSEGSSVLVSVLTNDSDPEDDDLSIVDVSTPSQGTASIQPDHRVRYTPHSGACGTDTFAYTIEDEQGESASALVTVGIQNVEPIAVQDEIEVLEDTSILVDVLANDTDLGGSLVLLSSDTPTYGSATIVGEKIQYSPAPRFEGTDTFSYTIEDSCGAIDIGQVTVRVIHANHPPTANAGSTYQGVVDEALVLDASFSHDPDLEDTLQYRWDLDGDGTPDTDWSTDSRLTTIFREPFFGQIALEVRDLYRGQPTGATAQATALVRIVSIQSLQVYVYEDLNGDGMRDPDEPGIPDLLVEVAGETAITEADGGISLQLDVGQWTASLSDDTMAQLENRGYAILHTEQTIQLAASAIETIALGVVKVSTRVKGVIYADSNGNSELDEDDRVVEGVLVMLDGAEENAEVTDESGSFVFRDVVYGSHEIYVEQPGSREDETPLSLLVPFTLSRTEKAEIHIVWPYPLGPQGGFLRVDVKREGEE